MATPSTQHYIACDSMANRFDATAASSLSPGDGTGLIKRLVAIPGDTVEMRNKILIVNGRPATYEPIGTAMEQVAPGVETEALRLDERTGARDHVVQWRRKPDAHH